MQGPIFVSLWDKQQGDAEAEAFPFWREHATFVSTQDDLRITLKCNIGMESKDPFKIPFDVGDTILNTQVIMQ